MANNEMANVVAGLTANSEKMRAARAAAAAAAAAAATRRATKMALDPVAVVQAEAPAALAAPVEPIGMPTAADLLAGCLEAAYPDRQPAPVVQAAPAPATTEAAPSQLTNERLANIRPAQTFANKGEATRATQKAATEARKATEARIKELRAELRAGADSDRAATVRAEIAQLRLNDTRANVTALLRGAQQKLVAVRAALTGYEGVGALADNAMAEAEKALAMVVIDWANVRRKRAARPVAATFTPAIGSLVMLHDGHKAKHADLLDNVDVAMQVLKLTNDNKTAVVQAGDTRLPLPVAHLRRA